MPEVVIDCAGAVMGGAARYLKELDVWLERRQGAPAVIGRNRRLTARWLLERERLVPKFARRIALNNVGFFRRGGPRVVLLRNALHFATEEELRFKVLLGIRQNNERLGDSRLRTRRVWCIAHSYCHSIFAKGAKQAEISSVFMSSGLTILVLMFIAVPLIFSLFSYVLRLDW